MYHLFLSNIEISAFTKNSQCIKRMAIRKDFLFLRPKHYTMVLVLALFVVGAVTGYFIRGREAWMPGVDWLTKIAIVVMLFLLGLKVGKNEEIVANLSSIGLQAFWLTLGAMAGSVLLIWVACSLFFEKKCSFRKKSGDDA